MLIRVPTIRTLQRITATQYASAFRRISQNRTYADEAGKPGSIDNTSGSSKIADTNEPVSSTESASDPQPDQTNNSLGSLLGSIENGNIGDKPKAANIPNFSKILDKDMSVSGDFTGFIGTGRFGGTTSTAMDNDIDPMDTLVLHVHASSNNTILTMTDYNGRVLASSSGGAVGFRKAQRAGFEPAYQATVHVANTIRENGIPVNKVEMRFKGFGAGRDAVFKAVHSVTNWVICRVVDKTPIPFNGCRPKKARRL